MATWARPYRVSPNARPPRRPILWALGGLVLGVALTLAVQVMLAPGTIAVPTAIAGGDIAISIDDAFVAQQAARGVANAQLPFSIGNVQAHINPGNTISIAGSAATGPFAQAFTATSQVWVANGQVQSHLTSAQVGGAELPNLVTGVLDSAIDAQLDSAITKLLPSNTGLSLSSISTSDGKLTLYIAQH